MFEHREGHPAPPGAGTASRLPRGHGSLALSITDATVFDDATHVLDEAHIYFMYELSPHTVYEGHT